MLLDGAIELAVMGGEKLPRWLEPARKRIEARLPEVRVPGSTGGVVEMGDR